MEVRNAFNVFDREGELCRNYTCCGIHLHDLHALLEHFEEVHVLVVDPAVPPQLQVPFNPQPGDQRSDDDMELELDLDNNTHPQPMSNHSSPHSAAPSPPNHHYTHYTPFTSAHTSPYTSQPPSPVPVAVHFPHAGPGTPSVMAHPEDAFNTYARFAADYSSHMPGTQFNQSAGDEIVVNLDDYSAYTQTQQQLVPAQPGPGQQCIPPALLFASSSSNGAAGAGGSGEAPKLKLKVRGPASPPSSAPPTPSTAPSTPAPTPATSNHPAPTSLLLSKPFRCPKPNCNKSYKQANGLKYHMTHGSCNFAPPKDLEHVKDLLERKRREREAAASSSSSVTLAPSSSTPGLSRSASLPSAAQGEPLLQHMTHSAYGDLGAITETELREVEREAERRVRPFACGVGDCQRRYKNMNGLRYHYQHSGDHGAVGLALLAGGVHECLGTSAPNNANNTSNTNSEGAGKGKSVGYTGGEEREGRRRGGAAAGVHRSVRGGSASVPVSRAGSVSRVSTPAQFAAQFATGAFSPNSNTSAPSTPGGYSGTTTPFTPGYTNLQSGYTTTGNAAAAQYTTTSNYGAATNGYAANANGNGSNTSPPLTPLTAAVQGLGLGSTTPRGSESPRSGGSPPHMQSQAQSQLGYQAQFAELQRRQYLQAQQQAAQQQAAQQQAAQQQAAQQQAAQQYAHQQQQQQYQYQPAMMSAQQVDQAQREFVEAQRAQAQAQGLA